jgi:hypothetical protein
MSIKQYPGGIVTKNPTAPTTSAAKGIWTLDQAQNYTKQGIWPRSPGAPTIGTATAGSGSATVAYTVPTDLGAGAITYTATSSPGGLTGTGASPITVSGLTNGTAYTFTVTATTPGGTGPASAASNSITPVAPSFMANLYGGLARSVVTDSSDNILMLGYDTNNQYVNIAKYTNAGVLVYQKQTSVSGTSGNRIAIDSSGNMAVGTVGGGQQRLLVYDSTGALTWQRYISGWPSGCSGATPQSGAGVCFDPSGNVYIGTPVYYACLYGYTLSKFNSSGTKQWSRTFTNNLNSNPYTSLASDSAGNIYFTTGRVPGSGYYTGTLVKVNSSDGTTIWNRFVDLPCNYPNTYGQDVVVDSSDNVYMTGNLGTNSFVAKYNSSGTNQWVKQASFGAQSYSYGVSVDTSGNVYLTGHYLFDYKMYMIKLNSSGTEQWQRQMTANTSGWKSYGEDAHVDSGGNPVFVGTLNNAADNRMFIMKPPSDGSATGTYTLSGLSWTYSASSASISTPSVTLGTGGPSNSAISLSASASSYTVSNGSLTTGTTIL